LRCQEVRVIDGAVCCELDEHPFDSEQPCKATVIVGGVKWRIEWAPAGETDTE